MSSSAFQQRKQRPKMAVWQILWWEGPEKNCWVRLMLIALGAMNGSWEEQTLTLDQASLTWWWVQILRVLWKDQKRRCTNFNGWAPWQTKKHILQSQMSNNVQKDVLRVIVWKRIETDHWTIDCVKWGGGRVMKRWLYTLRSVCSCSISLRANNDPLDILLFLWWSSGRGMGKEAGTTM